MIKVRFQSLERNSSDYELQIRDGELLSDAFERSLEGIDTGDFAKDEVFKALVNGVEIEKELLETVKLNKNDHVLICPVIKRGEERGLFIQIAVLVATVYTGGLAGGGIVGALAGAAAGIATGLALNALIPPPRVPTEAAGVAAGEDSQMYSVSGQSNIVKKLATVPKVYGRHRVFPTIAANPYTQLENDVDGELVQYLYAIYDFGFGPGIVENLRIGDTPIEDFTEVEYRFVDLNKPTTDEGSWDKVLDTEFLLYKNDVETEILGIGLNGNSNESGTPIDEYQAVRNSAANTEDSPQTIQLSMVCPEGLVGFSSQGTKIQRDIDIKIEFRKVGDTTWRAFNDPVYTHNFTSVGGKPSPYGGQNIEPLDLPNLADNNDNPAPFSTLVTQWWGSSGVDDIIGEFLDDPNYTWGREAFVVYGFAKGTNKLYLKDSGANLAIGRYLYFYNQFVGVVTSTVNYPGGKEVTIDRSLEKDIPIYKTLWSYGQGLYGDSSSIAQTPTDLSINQIKSNTSSTGFARITGITNRALYSTFSFTPKDVGQFEIRVTRNYTLGDYGPDKFDKLTWQSIVTRLETIPIKTEKRHVFFEIRIKATNQLNGNIDDLSGEFASALEVYDDGTQTWSRQLTNNPAWVFTDLLIGEVNKKAIAKDRLDLDSIVEWADYCDEAPTPPTGVTLNYPRFQCDFILDYRATLQEVLGQVANSAQASLNMVDGKYGALLDIDRVTPVQLFTPRNSKDFSVSRNYSPQPHALKVRFVDPSMNWELNEILVYDDGYDVLTATDIDNIETFACTNHEQAWRFGRFMMAQNKYRQETMSLTVDFEHLICTRGDFVQISQDVMRVGGRPARVKDVTGLTVTIDDSLDYPVGPTFGYVFRNSNNGVIYQGSLTPLTPSTFTAGGTLPEVGDLIVVGETDNVVFDCIVKGISPNDDFSAQLALVERAVQVYDYESDDAFSPYEPKISLISDPNLFPPSAVENLVVTETGWDCAGGGYEFYAQLDWDYPEGSVFEYFEIHADYGLGYTNVDRTSDTSYRYIVPDIEFLGETFKFKILAVSAAGKKIPLGEAVEVSDIIADKTTAPSDVEVFGTDITNEVLQLSWDRITDCDASEYLIRFSPNTSGAWNSSIPLMRVDASTSTVSTQARSGVYLIKAIDFNGNESDNEARAITTIPELFNLNVIETVTDAPTFTGAKDNVVVTASSLILKESVSGLPSVVEYYTPGYYYYENLLDLGEIYSVRLQSLIEAEGYNIGDLMSNWTTLASVSSLSIVGVADWEVQTQYRSTDVFNTISLWADLTSISTISGGSDDIWTEWRPFNMGDATGRIFQFRLKLVSNKAGASPRVFDATIKADMPDRIDNYNNLVSDAVTGYTVTYSPAFKGPGTTPNIQISLENAQSGDYWTFTNRDLEGFTVKFFDKNDVGVARTFDAMVKGFGRKNNVVI